MHWVRLQGAVCRVDDVVHVLGLGGVALGDFGIKKTHPFFPQAFLRVHRGQHGDTWILWVRPEPCGDVIPRGGGGMGVELRPSEGRGGGSGSGVVAVTWPLWMCCCGHRAPLWDHHLGCFIKPVLNPKVSVDVNAGDQQLGRRRW